MDFETVMPGKQAMGWDLRDRLGKHPYKVNARFALPIFELYYSPSILRLLCPL